MAAYKCAQVSGIKSSFNEAIDALEVRPVARQAKLSGSEVRIAVRASALNFFDLLQLVGKYQMKPALPFTPGAEGAGVVLEVGDEVKRFKVGDRVMFGMVLGALAEEAVLGESALMPAPASLSWAECAAFPVGYLTAYHALVTRAQLKARETLLVTGAAGGMGVTAIQLAKALGARVIAAASSAEKLAECRRMGADEVVNYATEDLRDRVFALTDGRGVDAVYEVVGGKVFRESLRALAGGGRLLVVGFTSGEIPSVAVNLALVKGISIVGVRSGAELMLSAALMQETTDALLALANAGKLRPPVARQLPLTSAGVREALRVLAERKAVGKIVVLPSNDAKL